MYEAHDGISIDYREINIAKWELCIFLYNFPHYFGCVVFQNFNANSHWRQSIGNRSFDVCVFATHQNYGRTNATKSMADASDAECGLN